MIVLRKTAWSLVLALVVTATPALGQLRRFRPMNLPAGGGAVNLPYVFNDNANNIWRVYNNGWMQVQGNQPTYSQGAMLTINGNQPNQPNNQARVDEKTGELIIENMQADTITVTRRISFDKDENVFRYIDIFHNTGNADQVAAIQIQSNLNFGVNTAQFVADPKHKEQNIAWVAQTGGGGSVLEMYAGKGAKVAPTLNWPQGSNWVQANLSLTIPAGKELALMHLHKPTPTPDAGVQYCTTLKESKLLKTIPIAIRRIIVNFPATQGWIGDIELLRGDALDVVELRTADQFRGTIKETSFDLQTFYGAVTVPVDEVVAIVNVGQFRPRELLVTVDGQVFGGYLKKPAIDLQMSSGQITQIPLAQVSRVGYRKKPGEPEEWTFEKPMVLMRTGERMFIVPPATPLDIATRYGKLSLKPEVVAAVAFQSEDSGVHEIFLTDGSRFSGLADASEVRVTLETGNQAVTFPVSAIQRLQVSAKTPEIDDAAPTIRLLNDDVLVGTLEGKLSLETAFDTIAINANEIRQMLRPRNSVQDVQVVLWDGTSLSGQLQEPMLNCRLSSGVTMTVPLALLDSYAQPRPRPSASTIDKIKSLVLELNAEDWKQRDRAQASLIQLGTGAIAVLKDLRANQPPETQKSIDFILQKLDDQLKKEKPAAPPGATGATPNEPVNANNVAPQFQQVQQQVMPAGFEPM